MDERLHELRRKLDRKTSEIETVLAAEQGMGSIETMDPSDYERLQQDVEDCWDGGKKLLKTKGRGAWKTPR